MENNQGHDIESASLVASTPQEAKPIPEKPERLNVGDSIGFAGILVGVLLVIIVPPLWIKIPLMFSVCLGTFMWVRRSLWTHGWSPRSQYVSASIFCVMVLAIGIPQFISQWKQEHSLPFSMRAYVAAAHQDDQVLYGIKWKNAFKDIRLEIEDMTEYPVHDLNLTVQVLENSGDTLLGMGQVSDIAGVEFHGPEWPRTGFVLQGKDGGPQYGLEPADFLAHMPFGNHWKMLHGMVPTGIPLRLAVASFNSKPDEIPEKIKVLGTYEIKTNEGDRVSAFERIVTIR
jgi:hypothetical protein